MAGFSRMRGPFWAAPGFDLDDAYRIVHTALRRRAAEEAAAAGRPVEVAAARHMGLRAGRRNLGRRVEAEVVIDVVVRHTSAASSMV